MAKEQNPLTTANSSTTLPVEGDLFDSLLLHHEAIMLWIDPESGRILNANLAASRFYGYSRIRLQRMHIEELNVLPVEEVARRRLQALDGTRSRFTFPHRLATGEIRTVDVYCSPVSHQGRVVLFSVVFDTSERQRAESFLVYRKRLLSLITDLSLHFVNLPLDQIDSALDRVLEEAGSCFEVDRAYIFDYDDARGTMTNTHEWCMEGIEPQIDQLKGLPQSLLPDWVAAHKRGEIVRVLNVAALPKESALRQLLEPQEVQSLITVPLMAQQQCLGFIGFDSVRRVRDWTEDEITLLRVLGELLSNVDQRRWAERELYLRSLALASAAHAVAITSGNGVLEWVNPAFEAMTGLKSADVLGGKLHWLAGEAGADTPKAMFDGIWKTLMEGRVWRGERCRSRANGERYYEEATLTPVRNALGEMTQCIAIMQDVSERRALQEQLHRSQRLESIGRLAGGIAHDLNNVLSPVLLGAELIRSTNEDPGFQRNVSLIEESAKRGMAIIRQILTFARGESGMRIPLDLTVVIERLLDVLRGTLPKNIELRFEAVSELPWVRGDRTQLEQVVLNLCVNAKDAMPDGGVLELQLDTVVLDEDACSRHQGSRPGAHVLLHVFDSGDGIDPEIMANIFDPFFTTKDVGRGTGLGLSVVQGIVRAHDGFINVASKRGEGTQFIVGFPACEPFDPILPEKDSAGRAVPRGNGEIILLVDDEEMVREILKRVLEDHGYRVVDVEGGGQAVRVLEDKTFIPHLVLTDLAMPDLDGAMLLMHLKTSGHPSPVVVMTGLLPQDPLRTRFLTRADALLRKPFTTADLMNIVASLLKAGEVSR